MYKDRIEQVTFSRIDLFVFWCGVGIDAFSM